MPMIWAPVAGVCNRCKALVQPEEMADHPCESCWFDTGWHALVNPDNTEWVPGYRFWVSQASKRVGRYGRHKVKRTYRVFFEIDQEGRLRHTGGPKPTEETVAGVEALYARERPGSNGGPPLD